MSNDNTYLVSGTREQEGEVVGFQEELTVPSSRDAYLTIINATGYTKISVVAIKMKCLECGDCHITVPSNLYLY